MNRQVPTLGKLLTMVLFALSCFGLTLFLWLQFGGAIPFKAQGYRITTTFPEATQLATEADVRIAGVAIGRVKKVVPGTNGRSTVTFELQRRYTPLPKDTKAILRQKTLLGETYIALSPPAKPTGFIEEGGRIPDSDVGTTTELDELFSTFDPPTRKAFQEWMQEGGKGLSGQGANLGKGLVEIQMLVSDLSGTAESLNEETPRLASALRDGKRVLNATTTTPGALRRAIVETERVFRQTGQNDAALTAFVQKLPRFLSSTRTGLESIEDFSTSTGAATTRLLPTARELAPATKALTDVAPSLNRLLTGVERVNKNAVKGLPATEEALKALPATLDGLDPFLKQLNPILEYTGLYSNQLVGALANLAAATSVGLPSDADAKYRDGESMRALRGGVTLQSSGLAASNTRYSTDQANAYRRPNWAGLIGQGLADVYAAQSCGTTVPRLPDTDNAELNALESQGPGKPAVPDVSLIDALRYTLFDPLGYFAATPTTPDGSAPGPSSTPAPTTPTSAPRTCTVQQQYSLGAGRLTTYPQLPAAPTSTNPSVTGP
ncbi:MAG: MCE family protein [Solirubrobacteraceae bacterium]|nr:MCE family protein [Solirubrobacteraceae bacterium]